MRRDQAGSGTPSYAVNARGVERFPHQGAPELVDSMISTQSNSTASGPLPPRRRSAIARLAWTKPFEACEPDICPSLKRLPTFGGSRCASRKYQLPWNFDDSGLDGRLGGSEKGICLQGIKSGDQEKFRPDQGIPLSSAICAFALLTIVATDLEPCREGRTETPPDFEVAEADLELGFVHPQACRKIARRTRQRELLVFDRRLPVEAVWQSPPDPPPVTGAGGHTACVARGLPFNRNRRFREPDGQAPALAQGDVIGGPIRHSVPLPSGGFVDFLRAESDRVGPAHADLCRDFFDRAVALELSFFDAAYADRTRHHSAQCHRGQ
jgi:hypothetical protein